MSQLQGYEQLMARFKAIGAAGDSRLMGTLGHAVISEAGNLAKPHRRTGTLIRSLHLGTVTNTSVQVIAGANYAAVFQFGSRPHDITRERKLTNMRQSTGEELERLVPARVLSLEQALEFCADGECVEVTPSAVRLRKAVLDGKERMRERGRRARGGE